MSAKKRAHRPKGHAPTPGVVLMPPNPSVRSGWRARFRDPDTGRIKQPTLPADDARTIETREAWAKAKSKELVRRKAELTGGAPRRTGQPLTEAIKRYWDDNEKQIRPRTIEIYRAAIDKFIHWASHSGVMKAEQVTRERLLAFRTVLVNEPKRKGAKGGKRGAKVATDDRRDAASYNRELRAVRTVLGYLFDCDLLPSLKEGDLRRGLKQEKDERDAIEFLRVAELRALFEAAIAHDAETFTETRAEHASRAGIGTTRKFIPIGPMLALVTLTGTRFNEALSLPWEAIDLNNKTITLDPKVVKTKHSRVITLRVCPALVALLNSIRPADGAGRVFPRVTKQIAKDAMARIQKVVPRAGWQCLRRTCSTYSMNAPALWGDAAAFVVAKRMGHSVQVSEKRYAGIVEVSPNAHTLEDALQIADLLARL